MKKVLLCPPGFYDITYEINPWMHVENKVNQAKVKKEFEDLISIYKELHLTILKIPQERGLPDMVYSANFGFPIGNTFIISNFKFPERQKESIYAKNYFQKLGYVIEELPKNIAFEGQGDLLTIGGKFFMGWGKRSDKSAKRYLEKIFKNPIIDFELINPYYYHLDTCFLPLTNNTVAINPQSFTKKGLVTLKKTFKHIIEVSPEDNNLIACNAVVVNKTIFIGK